MTKKLPALAQKRLQPFIDKGIQNGIFSDDAPVLALFKRKAEEMKDTVVELGGMKTQNAQRFITNCVMTDLSAMLRQKSFVGHFDIWACETRTTRTGRAMGTVFGQVVIEDGDSVMDSALFKMLLFDDDASLLDDVVAGRQYNAPISCRNLEADVLDIRTLSGMTVFTEEEYEHAQSDSVLRDTFELTPIAELENDISRSPSDYRLIEATVSYAGVQQSKSGSTFGKMLLKDDSTMTLEAIESGEGLMLNALCDTQTAGRFGKYSEVLALITTSMSEQYGLSATIVCAVGVVVVAPPKIEEKSGDDAEDNASSYFSDVDTIDLDSEDDEAEETTEEVSSDEAEEEEEEETTEEKTVEAKKDEGWTEEEDDWEDWE